MMHYPEYYTIQTCYYYYPACKDPVYFVPVGVPIVAGFWHLELVESGAIGCIVVLVTFGGSGGLDSVLSA